MRAYWPAVHIPGAVIAQEGETIPEADNYIWQKSFNLDFIKADQEVCHEHRHWWDICDPVWWFSPKEVARLLPYLAGIAFSSKGLRLDFAKNYQLDIPQHTIHDRLDLDHFPLKRNHEYTPVIRFIWYGISINRIALHGALTNLARLAANGYQIELTIMDDRPDQHLGKFDFPIYYTRWDLDKENAVLASHDIALLPPYPGPWGKVKSDNKKHTALACGLPVTDGHGYSELVTLVTDSDMRQRQAEAYPLELFDVRKSAQVWEAILCRS